jgi:AcrR family transcriptional regulator
MNTRDRVREAAVALFAEKGFSGTGIRDIALAAEISVASLYHYMSTKDDLLVDIMDVGLRRLLVSAQELTSRLSDPVERLAALAQLHVWVHGIRQQSALVCDTELRSLSGEQLASIVLLRDDYQEQWQSTVQEGVARGCMTVSDDKLTSLAMLEMCTGVSHWYRPNGPRTLRNICDLFAEMALALVRATVDGRIATLADYELPDPEATYLVIDAVPHSIR